MNPMTYTARRFRTAAVAAAIVFVAGEASAQQPVTAIQDLAKQEQPLLLDTLRDLVSIESGSKDLEGLAKLANLIAERLKQLGGKVEVIEPTDIYRMDDTPEKVGSMVKAEFQGTGTAKILLIGHMDTVYLRGMLKDQPFRIDGDKAYGLAIADDKQGIATILHSVAVLQKLGYKNYGKLTVMINGDEEISSPGSRSTITRVASEHDVVFSFEAGNLDGSLRLATSGIGAAYLSVQGKSSHAGANPEGGINALAELAHQILQLKDLSQKDRGLKLNWTIAQAGSNRNVIPAQATAQGDARALKVSDFDQLQATLQERIKNQLVPDAKVQLKFEVRRPPLEASDAARKLTMHGQTIYKEIGLELPFVDTVFGGGTDAAFAALSNKGAVLEGVGLSGFGLHSNDAEYVLISTIVPRLYLVTRLIADISDGKVK